MGDENDGLIAVKGFKIVVALLLEGGVADGEDFVEKENVAFGADGDREGEANLHAGRKVFEFLVHELLEFGELDDFVIHGVHFAIRKAKQGTV